LSNDNLVSIYSSGSGAVSGELIKLPIVLYGPNGREVLRESENVGSKEVPELFVKTGTEIIVAEAEDLKQFVANQLLPVIEHNRNISFNPSLDKHSEQVILQIIRRYDAKLAGFIKSSDIVKISEVILDLHTERQMCPMCAAACNVMLQDLGKHAEATQEVIESKGGKGQEVKANVTSTHPYGTTEHEEKSPVVGQAPTGHTKVTPVTQEDIKKETQQTITQIPEPEERFE
jgi:hypothetical protein